MNDLRCMTDLFPFLMALPMICEFGVATNAGILGRGTSAVCSASGSGGHASFKVEIDVEAGRAMTFKMADATTTGAYSRVDANTSRMVRHRINWSPNVIKHHKDSRHCKQRLTSPRTRWHTDMSTAQRKHLRWRGSLRRSRRDICCGILPSQKNWPTLLTVSILVNDDRKNCPSSAVEESSADLTTAPIKHLGCSLSGENNCIPV